MLKGFINKYLGIFIILLLLAAGMSCNKSETAGKAQQSQSAGKQDRFNVQKKDKPVILFYGNSITAGYGVDLQDAFSSLLAGRLDSLGYEYRVINAGVSGETSASGLSRIKWTLRTKPDIFVLELGANDGLRGLDIDNMKKNLLSIIAAVKESNPAVKILLAGMEVPPSMGEDYVLSFRKVWPEISRLENVILIPFILDKVAGEPELNQGDGIHPTEEGHRIIAETVWEYLEPLLEKIPS